MTDWAGRLRWYRGRARTFEAGESQWRIKDGLGRLCWAVHIPTLSAADIAARRGPSAAAWPLPDLDSVSRRRLAAHGHELLAGRVVLLGWPRSDALAPDWASDGRRPGTEPPALDPAGVVSLKHIWELSRHGVLTELAAAEVLGGVNGGCAQAMNLLGQWLAAHEVPRGMPFSSGVELAMRVQHWVWLRRLVGRATPFDQARAALSFERSPVFVRSLRHHVELLQRFPSRYSSANNHRLAEASGLVVASLGFPWFRDSPERAERYLREQSPPKN